MAAPQPTEITSTTAVVHEHVTAPHMAMAGEPRESLIPLEGQIWPRGTGS